MKGDSLPLNQLHTLGPILCVVVVLRGYGACPKVGRNSLETHLANEIPCVENSLWHHTACADSWATGALAP